jgi:hypothetical protein
VSDHFAQRRHELIYTIHAVLSEYPELAGEASQAIGLGVQSAMRSAHREAADLRTAMALSLALLPPNRLTDAGRSALEQMILRVLPDKAAQTKSERKFSEAKEASREP